VRLGKPKDPENYDRMQAEGIDIYYRSSLGGLFRKITLTIEKLLFIKNLVASGEK
jgi:hypothetical protein